MPERRTCVECGSPVPGGSANGVCPKCCLALAVGTDGDGSDGPHAAALTPSKAGQTLGGYELIELIGEGGMGVV